MHQKRPLHPYSFNLHRPYLISRQDEAVVLTIYTERERINNTRVVGRLTTNGGQNLCTGTLISRRAGWFPIATR